MSSPAMSAELAAVRINELLRNARARGASDVHFGGAERPAIRVDGRLIILDGEPLPESALLAFLRDTLTPAAYAQLSADGMADGAQHATAIGSFRIHAYRQLSGLRIVIRLLAATVPQLAQLELPAIIESFTTRPQGLVLFTGPTGSGKTTALAGAIDCINRSSERNIITIEDPIEYVHAPLRSLVTHCEIGRDVRDYAQALRGLMRADPDVILIGELRDRATMAAAMTAAETGHLVFTTLHTNDAAQTVDRIVDSFVGDAQQQIRAQLAAVLVAVVSLRLIPRRSGRGRRAVAEILCATDGVRNLIREGKTHQLRNAIVTGRDAGMQTLELDLSTRVARGEISLTAAQAASSRPHEIRQIDRMPG